MLLNNEGYANRCVAEILNTQTRKYVTYAGNPKLMNNVMAEIPILLPPLEEQEKIAEILNLWDAQIAEVQDLIHHKQRLKTGLMQKLFTQSLRFKGFAQDWEIVRLGDVAEIIMGSSPKSSAYNNVGDGLPLIQGKGSLKDRYPAPKCYTSKITKTCKEGDIILSVRAPVGYVAKSTYDACIGRGVCAIRAKNGDFLYFVLIYMENAWLGQGSIFEAVNKDEVKKFRLPLPSLEEQEKIAEILSVADEEIELLVQKHQALETQKRALMQRLLTGKVRV